MAEAVRWGILGTGKISRAFANALKDVPGAMLAAVASRSHDKAAAFAQEFGAPASYGSYEALAQAEGIDLMYIGTPHPEHAGNALMALRAGKGVLCEKPFTMNLREAEQVVTLARSKRLFLMEAMWTRYLPAYLEGVERDIIQRALQQTQFNRTRTASLLGISVRQLRYQMQKLDIQAPEN